MKNIYIIEGKRTAIGSLDGSLAKIGANELAIQVVKNIISTTNIAPHLIDEVIIGNVLSAGLGQNVARQIQIGCEIPANKTALSINMVCGSGLRAITLASQSIIAGDADIILAGGTENMSQAPYLLKKARSGYRLGHGELIDSLISDGLWDYFNDFHMGITAENLAEKYKISREEQDEFALNSQLKAQKAIKNNKFIDEIVKIEIPQRKNNPKIFDTDEYPRFDTNLESLAKLKPAFKKNGSVTAGNSSGINDGASVFLLASSDAVERYNLNPKAKIVSYAYAGVDPSIMGIGPVQAVKKALDKANWKISDLELIEANEAFAVQSIAVNKELGWNEDIINVNGGAIALGHPIGASGARILVTLIYEMEKRKLKKGLATLCIGGGMGIAICIERI